MALNLRSLIDRLDDTCRNALEGAAGLCLARTNYDVELEHFLLKLLEAPDSDLAHIVRHYELKPERLTGDLTRSLDRLKTGNARTPALSPRLPRLLQEAWLLASIDFGAARIRSGHLLLALLANDDLARLVREITKEFNHVPLDTLRDKLAEITAGSAEDAAARQTDAAPAGDATDDDEAAAATGQARALDRYTIDLTARARAGQIDPVLERDFEIRQIIDILMRRRQNNPILTGEAGVGKTAIVEGFALRVAQGEVPEPLKHVAVRTLDLGLLQAGAGIKGEFENRLKSVISEVKASPRPVILFIDEAHTMIGAGGQAGGSDAANLLKPALARGELRTIAATTWAEYKKYFEKDDALARRFQVVKVEEPDEAQGIIMMRGLMETLEKHHKVRILDEAVIDAVRLSHRYISGRLLPDKAVSVLDTACARVAIGQAATPPAIEDAERRSAQLATEIGALEREAVTGADHQRRVEELQAARTAVEENHTRLMTQWEGERELIDRIRDIRAQLEDHALSSARGDGAKTAAGGADTASDGVETKEDGTQAATATRAVDVAALRAELTRLNTELEGLQGESPLMQACVDSQTVAQVISGWTGIPVGKMLADEINTVLSLKQRLEQRVIGQSQALEAVAQRIRTSRANLTDPRRPVGVFLLVGPSGVGKTETALALAETLYGGERNLVSINMSEYQESYTISALKGSPPGYVGYGEGGVLTEAVRRRPYSVVLLDEAEKAHSDVLELFYQVFDKGQLEDGEGREVDFKHTIILLTSNVGTETIMRLCADKRKQPDTEALTAALRPELLKVFKPALLGRMTVVPYFPISDEVMREIIKLQLSRITRRLAENHRAAFTYDEALVTEIANRCREVESGARNVDHILTRTLLPEMSGELLARMAADEGVSGVHVSVGDGGHYKYEIS
jgi:type VI secretion system protein VasG